MNSSVEIKDLCEALSKAQGEFNVAHRSKKNPFFRSNYADLEAIVEAARPSLVKNGLSFVQMTKTQDGQLLLVTRIMHSSGQWIEGEYPVKIQKDDPQGYGAAVTYSRRYALAAALGVVASDEDDDAEKAVDHKEDIASVVEKILKHFSGLGVSRSRIEARIGCPVSEMKERDVTELRRIATEIQGGASATEIFPIPNKAVK